MNRKKDGYGKREKPTKYNENSLANLKPQPWSARPNHKELASKGGKASAQKRKEFRHAKDLLTDILSQDMTSEEVENILGKDVKNRNTYNVILLKMAQVAQSGNVKAFEALRDTVGDKPTEDINLNANVITDKDRELLNILGKALNTEVSDTK